MEVQHLLTDSGFEVVRLETGEFLDEPHPEHGWIKHLLERYRLHTRFAATESMLSDARPAR